MFVFQTGFSTEYQRNMHLSVNLEELTGLCGFLIYIRQEQKTRGRAKFLHAERQGMNYKYLAALFAVSNFVCSTGII